MKGSPNRESVPSRIAHIGKAVRQSSHAPAMHEEVKNRLTTIALVLMFLLGLSLVLYPAVSDWWNVRHQSRVVTDYVAAVDQMDDQALKQAWSDAQEWNDLLRSSSWGFELPDDQYAAYEEQLNVLGNGVMGYLEIPKISCSLPIYHGVESDVLQNAIGHIDGTSLPVGGASTHCVLSGHRGLPSATLLSNLDRLTEGDTFCIHTLDQTLTYEVDQILTVLPYEVSSLAIQDGQDLCTLVTCTPYGINTHRLLVRGHRIYPEDGIRVEGDAVQIDTSLVAVLLAVPVLLALLAAALLRYRHRQRR